MSLHRLWTVASCELRFHLAGPLLWILVVLAALASATIDPTALIPATDSEGGASLLVNSRYAIAQSLALVTFFLYSFFAAILAGSAVVRDEEVGVADLLHSTPLTAAELVVGKCAGISLALALALGLHGLTIWGLMHWPAWNGDQPRGAFELGNFVIPALAFAVPGMLFSAGLAFAVGERTRQPMAALAVPTTLFLLTVYVFNAWPFMGLSPWLEKGLMILDPTGLRWLRQTAFAVDRGAAFYNSAPFGFDATFLVSRLFALGLPTLLVFGSIRRLRRAGASARARSHGRGRLLGLRRGRLVREAEATPALTPLLAPSFRALGELGMGTSPLRFARNVAEVSRAEAAELCRMPGVYLFGFLALAMVLEVATSAEVRDVPTIATAGELAVGSFEVLTFVLALLLLFSLVESLGREARTGIDAIVLATPIDSRALLWGKGLASAGVVVVILGLALVLASGLLLADPQARLTLTPFLIVWGFLLLPSLFAWGAFVTMLWVLVRARSTATATTATVAALGLAALGVSGYRAVSGAATWATDWTLAGSLRWSDFGAFELDRSSLLANRALVVAVGILCAVIATRGFPRTERDVLAAAHRARPAQGARAVLRLLPWGLPPLGLGLVLALGVEAGFQSEAARAKARDAWRRNAVDPARFEPPAIEHAEVAVALEPSKRRAVIRGTYLIVNPSARSMAQLPFSVSPTWQRIKWTLDGAAAAAKDRGGVDLLTLPSPLPPGGRRRVGFVYEAEVPRGASRRGGGVEQFILPSGVVLHTLRDSFLPAPGFVARQGVEDESDAPRERRGEGPAVGPVTPFTVRAEISAPSEYTVISVGDLVAQRRRAGRTTWVWRTRVPVRAWNILAGRWAARRRDGVAVFHHPKHTANVEEMLTALAAARAHYSSWFFPYPWAELRLGEFPNLVSNAQGFPSNISFSEGVGFLSKSGPETRAAFTVAAHEAAHQWWGNLLNPQEAAGADVLIEGMAHYSTLLLHEKVYGPESRIRFARELEARYLAGRRVDSEPPLLEIVDSGSASDETVIYDKGAWALWMLDRHVGRERMLAGLRELIRRYGPNGQGFARLSDLLAILTAQNSAEDRAFVETWFEGVALPEIRLRKVVVVAPQGDGVWRVSASIENVGTGTVEVEVAAQRGDRSNPESHPRERRIIVRLAPGVPRTLHWDLPFAPELLIVDPEVQVLQANRVAAAYDFAR